MKGFLRVFSTVCRGVFLLLALVVVLGILVTLAPTNHANVIVKNILDLSRWAAGPLRDVFTGSSPSRTIALNYGVAAVVYLVAASLVRRLLGRS